MSYSNDIKYIITAEDRNGSIGFTNRYVGLYFNSNGEVYDFAIFYTVDGYLDNHNIYISEDDAKKDLDIFRNKYANTGNRRYDSLRNLRVKSIVGMKGTI